jgi:hypothetical protein
MPKRILRRLDFEFGQALGLKRGISWEKKRLKFEVEVEVVVLDGSPLDPSP